MDVWIAADLPNAEKLFQVLIDFGFGSTGITPNDLTQPRRVLRMGEKPLLIEVQTTISGVEFGECYPRSVAAELDGIAIQIISLEDLKQNKRAAGRHKDLGDLDYLP